MPGNPDTDELIDRLVAAETVAPDSSLADVQSQIEAIESRARRPRHFDPFTDEPQCRHAVERVVELGRELSSSAPADAAPCQTVIAAEQVEMLGQYPLLAMLGEGGWERCTRRCTPGW
jgi:hypothetical protein